MPHCFTLRPSTAAFKCCACNPIRLLRKEQQQEERRRKKKKEEERRRKTKSFGQPTSC